MAIPESQLKTWSHHESAANVSSVQAYESLRNRLQSIGGYSINHDYEIFLQGSYGNTTNIFGESSDVDVIVKLKKIFQPDISSLSLPDKIVYNSQRNLATYRFEDFRKSVLEKLIDYFGYSNVVENNKSVQVQTNYRKADVIIAYEYRKYYSFISSNTNKYYEGIIFNTRSGHVIINYPKIHIENGIYKNGKTLVYKKMIRVFKKARNKAIDLGYISKGDAPSYFVECLLYNVPNSYFTSDYSDSFDKIKDFLYDSLDKDWMCQNKIVPIFGNDITSWSIDKAKAFVKAMKDLWDNWE